MDQITTDQLNTLATQFLGIGKAILAYRENNAGISTADDGALEQLQNELLDKAGQLATMAAIQSGQEAAAAVQRLTEVNNQVTQTLQNLTDVQKVIDIATAALKVVVSVVKSMDPGDIVDAADGLAAACNIRLPQA